MARRKIAPEVDSQHGFVLDLGVPANIMFRQNLIMVESKSSPA